MHCVYVSQILKPPVTTACGAIALRRQLLKGERDGQQVKQGRRSSTRACNGAKSPRSRTVLRDTRKILLRKTVSRRANGLLTSSRLMLYFCSADNLLCHCRRFRFQVSLSLNQPSFVIVKFAMSGVCACFDLLSVFGAYRLGADAAQSMVNAL